MGTMALFDFGAQRVKFARQGFGAKSPFEGKFAMPGATTPNSARFQNIRAGHDSHHMVRHESPKGTVDEKVAKIIIPIASLHPIKDKKRLRS
ncbi:hypothetical protein FJZ26_06140 [Candidatus Parvarchaeota archaeon]|nr:hypothetical protein [Candidatus Parvarchaeota archaeon]